MIVLVGIAAVVAVCLVGNRSCRGVRRLDKAHFFGYEHRARCDEVLPLDYLSR